MIADWNVQRKIKDSLESVRITINKVSYVIERVSGRYENKAAELEKLNSAVKDIIEQARD